MRVLVCGSRDWTDAQPIAQMLHAAWETAQLNFHATHVSDMIVMHGKARGADTIADTIARARGHTIDERPADWRGQGRRAGILRNLAMLDEAPDLVLAFQLNGSRGTQHAIDEARRRGIETVVVAR